MPRTVAVPLARFVRLSNRNQEERPAMRLERSPDNGLPVLQPRPMDQWTPAPSTVTPLPVDDLSAARTQLPIGGKPRRPDLSDEFFRAPKGRPLFVRIGRNESFAGPAPVETG